jgi:hypothetical protein
VQDHQKYPAITSCIEPTGRLSRPDDISPVVHRSFSGITRIKKQPAGHHHHKKAGKAARSYAKIVVLQIRAFLVNVPTYRPQLVMANSNNLCHDFFL